jgi:hypothetical protein
MEAIEEKRDALGRELCPRCGGLMPATSDAREIHLLRHVVDDLNQTLTWIGETLQSIKNWGIPTGSRYR